MEFIFNSINNIKIIPNIIKIANYFLKMNFKEKAILLFIKGKMLSKAH